MKILFQTEVFNWIIVAVTDYETDGWVLLDTDSDAITTAPEHLDDYFKEDMIAFLERQGWDMRSLSGWRADPADDHEQQQQREGNL